MSYQSAAVEGAARHRRWPVVAVRGNGACVPTGGGHDEDAGATSTLNGTSPRPLTKSDPSSLRPIELYKEIRALAGRSSGQTTRTRRPTCTASSPKTVPKRCSATRKLATSAQAVPPAMRLPGLDPSRENPVTISDPAVPRALRREPQAWCDQGEIVLTGRVARRSRAATTSAETRASSLAARHVEPGSLRKEFPWQQ